VAADIAFAVDSIPAAFAITRDPFIIWMGNVFALLGLRALFVLVESLIARFRYLNATVAVVLALVALKLLTEDLYEVGPGLSLVVIAVCFATGMLASVVADRRDPQSASSGSIPSSTSSSSSSTASSTEESRSPEGS
jgi:tellurite resistance protein TerC